MPARNDLLDLQPYVGPPRLSAWSAVVLTLQLIKAAPLEMQERTRDALEALRAACINLQSIARDRLRLSPESLRPVDATLDSSWVALRMALEAAARLAGTEMGDKATYLLPRVLPRGTEFVKYSYEAQWNESENLLAVIDEEGLEAEIAALVGPHYLAFIRRAHAAFGEGLGLGETLVETPDTTAIAKAISEVAFAIAEYGRRMVGIELDRNDPASVARFKKAMAPLDRHRARQARSKGAEEDVVVEPPPPDPEDEGVDPTQPIPPIGA